MVIGKILSMIALCVFISSCTICSIVSVSDSLSGSKVSHVANRCSSLNVFCAQNGHFLIVGLMGVTLYRSRKVISFSAALECLLCVLAKHSVQSVIAYLYAVFILVYNGVAKVGLMCIYASLVVFPISAGCIWIVLVHEV